MYSYNICPIFILRKWLTAKSLFWTHFRPMFHSCRNQVVGFYYQNVWKHLDVWQLSKYTSILCWKLAITESLVTRIPRGKYMLKFIIKNTKWKCQNVALKMPNVKRHYEVNKRWSCAFISSFESIQEDIHQVLLLMILNLPKRMLNDVGLLSYVHCQFSKFAKFNSR